MSRRTVDIKVPEAQLIINALEKSANNQTGLCHAVADEYNKRFGTMVSWSVIYLRITKDKTLTTNLKAGKKGPRTGSKISVAQKQAMQAGRKQRKYSGKDISQVERLVILQKAMPGFEKLVERAVNGSKSAALKGMCLICAGMGTGSPRPTNDYQRTIRECGSVDCLAHQFRPYQIKLKVTE